MQGHGFGMVPASWAYIAKMSVDRIARYASQLRYIEIGSAFMPKTEKERLMRLLPDTKICMHYGLTEASRSAFIDFHTDMEHLDSVGKSSPGTEIVVCDEQGNLLAAGQEGELCVKADMCVLAIGEYQKISSGMIFITAISKPEIGATLITPAIYT